MLTQKVHLIGICGAGMGSLAGLLAAAGHSVRGSDENVYPPISTMLEENGIEVMSGYRPSNLEWGPDLVVIGNIVRSEEHTSELQSPCNLVCRLLLEKKKQRTQLYRTSTSPRSLTTGTRTSTRTSRAP